MYKDIKLLFGKFIATHDKGASGTVHFLKLRVCKNYQATWKMQYTTMKRYEKVIYKKGSKCGK